MAVLYGLVFTHQNAVIEFLNGAYHQHYKWVGSIAVFIIVPIIAYIYGTVTDLALKLINVD